MYRFLLSLLIVLAACNPALATVSSTNSRMDYVGNGAVDTYSYTYKIFAESDLLVTVRNTSDVETTLALSTDYTVTGEGTASGGNVALVNSAQAWLDGDGDLLTNYVLTIRRVKPITQETDIRNQGAFYPEVHEDQFDIQTMISQQQQDELNRSLKLPETIDPDDFDTNLPASIVGEAGASFITNPAGDGLIAGPTASAISGAQASAVAAAASASTASTQASAASASASAAAASAASVNLPAMVSLNVLQANAAGTAYQMMDLRAPNVGIGTVTPNAGKFTTVTATTSFSGPGALPTGAVFFMAAGSCPSWTTDVSATYANKFIKINATQLTSSGTVLTGTSDGTTLSAAQSGLPAHTHVIQAKSGGALGTAVGQFTHPDTATNDLPGATESTGGTAAASPHTHTFSSATTLEPSSITMKACQVN